MSAVFLKLLVVYENNYKKVSKIPRNTISI